MILSELETQIYYRDAQLAQLPSDSVFMSLLDRAITNVRSELRYFEPDKLEVWIENQVSPVSFPDDLEISELAMFYPKGEYELPMGSQYISERNSKWYVEGFLEFSVKYSKHLPRFTAMTQDLVFKSRKSEEIIISEMMNLIYRWKEENESTPSVQEAIEQSNRVK